jgi:hypothetical protein
MINDPARLDPMRLANLNPGQLGSCHDLSMLCSQHDWSVSCGVRTREADSPTDFSEAVKVRDTSILPASILVRSISSLVTACRPGKHLVGRRSTAYGLPCEANATVMLMESHRAGPAV